jgi:uncharacterized membrane protein
VGTLNESDNYVELKTRPSFLRATSLPVILFAIAIVVVLSAIFHASVLFNALPWSFAYSDILHFFDSAAKPGLFYIDKPIEYPVITGLLIQLAGILGKTINSYYLVNSLFLLLLALAETYILYRIAPDKNRIYRYWVLAPSMLIFAVFNWDLVAILFVLLAIFSLVANHRNYSTSTSLALGFSSKLYPALYLLPLMANTKRLSDRTKIVVIFVVGCLIINLPFAFMNFRGWYYFFSYNSQRLPNPDSIWGVIHYYIPQINVTLINILSLLIFAFAYLGVFWKYRHQSFLKLCFALTLIFMICNKIFSPQYMLWILPFFVLTPVNKKGLFYSLDICNLLVLFTILPYVLGYSQSMALLFSSQIFVVLREILLICLLYYVLRSDMVMHDENIISATDNYLSVHEAATVLGVDPGTVKKLCRAGKLQAKIDHKTWIIPSDIVHSFAKQYKRPGRK